jgi:hypothetical protein
MIMAELADVDGQRLVLVKGASTSAADRYQAIDPRQTPPRYWN